MNNLNAKNAQKSLKVAESSTATSVFALISLHLNDWSAI